jgi:hypoxanthine phosphoribosyltransferase
MAARGVKGRRFISWHEFGVLVDRLVASLASVGEAFDLVVGVARGGLPVSMVVADRLRVPIDFVNVKSYRGVWVRDRPRIVSTLTEDVAGKVVLVVDDLVDEGDTLEVVLRYLKEQGPRRIRTATLFIKPWSRFRPDYYLEVTDYWIVFPWELGEYGTP